LLAEAARRGLQLSAAVVDLILQRERRDLTTLLVALDRLDRAALAHGRAPSVPFVRQVLREEA
jgi:chromosomal replication initiation ATPase DnaA